MQSRGQAGLDIKRKVRSCLAHPRVIDLQGSRDCRAVRRLDFTAGRPSLQLDFAEAASTSVPDAAVPATALLWASAPLPATHANQGLIAMDSSSLLGEPNPSILGPTTPFSHASHQGHPQAGAFWPGRFDQDWQAQPFRSCSPLQPTDAIPLPTSGSHWQGGTQAAPASPCHSQQQHAQPACGQLPQTQPPAWQTGARILAEGWPVEPAALHSPLQQLHRADLGVKTSLLHGLEPLHAHSLPLRQSGPHAAATPHSKSSPALGQADKPAFAFTFSSQLPRVKTHAPQRQEHSLPCRAQERAAVNPFGRPAWEHAAMATPFALPGPCLPSMPLQVPNSSMQPLSGLPESPALSQGQQISPQHPSGVFNHPFGSHLPPSPRHLRLSDYEPMASRGSGTGAFLP